MRILLAADGIVAARLRERLSEAGIGPAAECPAGALDAAGGDAVLADVDVVVLEARRDTLSARAVGACDARSVRILAVCQNESASRLADAFGLLGALGPDADGWAIADALRATPPERPAGVRRPRVVAVWGPSGAPGRTRMAIELAAALARDGRRVELVDADTHAPALALALGLPEDSPGIGAACRRAELGGLDVAELLRVSTPLAALPGLHVLAGLNRPARWPEVSQPRLERVLEVCRDAAEITVVDVAASLERDEEIVSDLVDGPRRNAAALAALASADAVVAVLAADPVGVARFVRSYSELRSVTGATPVVVVANRLRPGALGLDARRQVRHTLERFAGVRTVWFVPDDPRTADAALLASRAAGERSPRSALARAVRRVAGEAVVGADEPLGAGTEASAPSRSRSRQRRGARRAIGTRSERVG